MPIAMPAFSPELSGFTEDAGRGARSSDGDCVATMETGDSTSGGDVIEVKEGAGGEVTKTVFEDVTVSRVVVKGEAKAGKEVGSGAGMEDELATLVLVDGTAYGIPSSVAEMD